MGKDVVEELVKLVAELAVKLAITEHSKAGGVPDGRLIASRVQWLLSPLGELLPGVDLRIPELVETMKRQIGNPWEPPKPE
jgi:hypothetical protein